MLARITLDPANCRSCSSVVSLLDRYIIFAMVINWSRCLQDWWEWKLLLIVLTAGQCPGQGRQHVPPSFFCWHGSSTIVDQQQSDVQNLAPLPWLIIPRTALPTYLPNDRLVVKHCFLHADAGTRCPLIFAVLSARERDQHSCYPSTSPWVIATTSISPTSTSNFWCHQCFVADLK
jgi:hypothetical protein